MVTGLPSTSSVISALLAGDVANDRARATGAVRLGKLLLHARSMLTD